MHFHKYSANIKVNKHISASGRRHYQRDIHTARYFHTIKNILFPLGGNISLLFFGIKKVPINKKGSSQSNYSLTTLIALGPFSPFSISKLTLSPSARVLKPLPWMDVWWTKTSVPSSAVMNPKPLLSLNHFTVPCTISFTSKQICITIANQHNYIR